MSRRIIPVTDVSAIPDLSGTVQDAAAALLTTRLSRELRDLRISVTDRCNFRCVYCMPREVFDKNYEFLPHSALLSFEEIERLARLFVAHGVEKIRLTGGEPLLRKNIEFLIERLALLRTPEGRPLDITLTTNGSLLARKARALKDAGLIAGDGQSRRARRCAVSPHERRRFRGRRRARRHRGRARRRASRR